MTDPTHAAAPQLSKHRIEALVDGIYAVAMTLLVIDLRIPEHAHITTEPQLREALLGLIPNLISWLISFFVLANFWIANHRLFNFMRHVDQGMLWLTILNLAGAALLPFASSINSQFMSFTGQVVYAAVMIILGLSTLFLTRRIHAHPELCAHPMSEGVYRATVARSFGVIVIATLAAWAARYAPGHANWVFVLMALLRPMGNRIERRYVAK